MKSDNNGLLGPKHVACLKSKIFLQVDGVINSPIFTDTTWCHVITGAAYFRPLLLLTRPKLNNVQSSVGVKVLDNVLSKMLNVFWCSCTSGCFFLGGGKGPHAVMMALVFRKNSHVDYDSHTSCTCLHLCCSLGLQLFGRLRSRSGTKKNTLLQFLVQKIRQFTSCTWQNLCKPCGFLDVIMLLRLQIWYLDVQLLCL